MAGFSLEVKSSDLKTPNLLEYFKEIVDGIVVRAKARTPVRTGALRDSISATENGDSFEIGSSLDYAGFIEFGTIYIQPYRMVGSAIEEIDQIADSVQVPTT